MKTRTTHTQECVTEAPRGGARLRGALLVSGVVVDAPQEEPMVRKHVDTQQSSKRGIAHRRR